MHIFPMLIMLQGWYYDVRCPVRLLAKRMRNMWSKEMNKDEPNLDTKFQYALLLIKSRSHDQNHEGMTLLRGEK